MKTPQTPFRSAAVLGACLALAAGASAQVVPSKGNATSKGGKTASVNQKPVAVVGPSQFVECTGQVTMIQLDGSLSYDPDGDPITFHWEIQGICDVGTLDDPNSPTPILSFDPNNNCLDECGKIALRVRDGKQNGFGYTAVVVTDLTAPAIVAPLDVVEPWTVGYPVQADPTVHGMALVSDCDPNASMTWFDTVTTGPLPSGVEDIVHRLWRSVDECGNVSEEVQVLVFVSESFFAGAPVDVFPSSCNNLIFTGPGMTTFDAALLAETGFNAGNVQPGTLKFKRADGIGSAVTPMSSLVVELGTPSLLNSCASSAPDNALDVLMTFDQNAVISAFKLNQEMGDAIVVVEVTGLDENGKAFRGYDLLRVKHLTNSGPPPTTVGNDPVISLSK